jgi:light-regulated signal transduction histidine kinase (bacteriophytochrome)
MIDVIKLISPYPAVDESGILSDGFIFHQPRLCQKCNPKMCLNAFADEPRDSVAHSVCPRGFSLVRFSWTQAKLLSNGLIVAGLNTVCPPFVRKAHQAQKVRWDEMVAWHAAVSKAIPVLSQYSEEKARELVEGLHDVTTAVSLVTRNAEAIIKGFEGESDEVKIENAPGPMKALLKSIELLHTRLRLSSIVANPASAAFGQKHQTPVYRVFHRMVRLFEELAVKRHVTIKITGASYHKPLCFESFDTLALVLIDNAVKYSVDGATVDVIIHDTDRSVKVAVQSYGPFVPKEAEERIFERGFRTEGATRFFAQGSGLGLFIAKVVAEVHGFEIRYKAFNVNQAKQEGQNEFLFEVPVSVLAGQGGARIR